MFALFGLLFACATLMHDEPAVRWWKGNTHAHTLWSDGDSPPELVTKWYRDAGYEFLVLSDHDVLATEERWIDVEHERPLVDELRTTFGEAAVDLRAGEAGLEMRLKTIEELRATFEAPGGFLLISGEEISAQAEGKPVHVNGLNLAETIAPVTGSSVLDTIQRSIDAVLAQGERLGRPVLAHLNHPNFGWAIGWRDLAGLRGERFFEVYNGHPLVRNEGDADHPSTERAWDLALTLRATELDLPLLYGLATDDAHDFQQEGGGLSNPGRGWIVVRARSLGAADLIAAMEAGDFYASTGVTLEDVRFDGRELAVDVAAERGVRYTVQFVGTRDGGEVGEILQETSGPRASYRCRGDELYVRARVTSTRRHPNPYRYGELETAWVQPVRPGS